MAGSELQNDATNAGIKTISEIIKGFFEIGKFLVERHDKNVDNRYKKALTETKLNRENAVEDSVSGKVPMKKLLGMKGETIATPVRMTESQFKEFCRLADRSGLTYSADVMNGGGEKKYYAVWYKRENLPIVAQIKDQMFINISTREINKEIEFLKNEKEKNEAEIFSLKEKMESGGLDGASKYDSEQRIDGLNSRNQNIEKQLLDLGKRLDEIYEGQIKREDFYHGTGAYEKSASVDSEQEQSETDVSRTERFERLAEGKRGKDLRTFDNTLNRLTNHDYSRPADKPLYVADRTYPNSYIEIHCDRDKDFKGEDYTKSTYTVYKDGEMVKNPNTEDGRWSDARFKERKRGYFNSIKAEMKNAGNFKDDLVVFGSRENLLKYQSEYKSMLEEQYVEKVESLNNGLNNYAQTAQDIRERLESKGYELREGDGKFSLYREGVKLNSPKLEQEQFENLDGTKSIFNTPPSEGIDVAMDLNDCKLMECYEKLILLQNKRVELEVKYENNEKYIIEETDRQGKSSFAGEITTDDVKRDDSPYVVNINDAKSVQDDLKNQISGLESEVHDVHIKIEDIHNNKNLLSSIKIHDSINKEREKGDVVDLEKEELDMEITHGEEEFTLDEIESLSESRRLELKELNVSEPSVGIEER